MDLQKKSQLKEKFTWVIAFLLSALAMYIMLSYSQVLSTGKYVILNGDSLEQYVSHVKMIYRNLLNGETPWFSFSYSMGQNTSIPLAWHVTSPFNLFYLIFWNADINKITALVVILKTATAAATFQIFSRKALKTGKLSSVLFGVFYSMCGYTVVMGFHHFIWIEGVYMLPVVALGIYKCVKEKKWLLLTFAYTYIFITQFYMGYMIGIFSFLMFVLMLIADRSNLGKRGVLGAIGRYALSFIISVLISAVIWVPFAFYLVKYRVSDSNGSFAISITVLDVLNNLFWGEFQGSDYAPYFYCGIPVLLLLPFYFINKKIEKKQKIVIGILLLFFILCCLIKPLYGFMHAFDAPNGYSFRFSYILSFLLCAIAAIQFEHIKEIGWKKLLICCGCLAALYLIVLILQGHIILISLGRNSIIGLFINASLISIWIVLGKTIIKNPNNKTIKLAMICFLLLEVISNGAVRINHVSTSSILVREDYYYLWDNDMKLALDQLGEMDDSSDLYRIGVYNDLIHNSDSLYGYNGFSDFSTGENEKLRKLLDNLGMSTMVRSTNLSGITPSVKMLLANKYDIRLYTQSELLGLDAPPKIEKNEYYLPIGYMVDEGTTEPIEMGNNVFENQNNLFKNISGIDNLYVQTPEDRLDIESYGLLLVNGNTIIADDTFDEEEPCIIFRVHDTENEAFIQFDSELPTLGIDYHWGCRNIANDEDYNASFSCAAQFWKSGNEDFIRLNANPDFPGAMINDYINIYELREDRLKEIYEDLQKECLQVTKWKNGYVKGNIYIEGDREVLFTSIPAVDGWKAYVDGEEAEIVKVINDVFIGVRIPEKGGHEIEFRYTCPGLKEGSILSLVGLVLLAGALALSALLKKKSQIGIKHE